MLQRVRGRTSAFTFVTPGPLLLPDAGSKRVGGSHFYPSYHMVNEGVQVRSVALMSSGLAHLCPQLNFAAQVKSMSVVRVEAIFPE